MEERYPWSSSKKWIKRIICVFLLLLANSIYGFDVFSDFKFSWDMFSNSMNNYTTDMNDCKQKVFSYVDTINLHCSRTNFSAASCFAVMKTGQTEGQCLDTMEEVSPEEWSLRGYISNAHIMAPVVFVLVCGLMDFRSWFDPSCKLIFSIYRRTKKFLDSFLKSYLVSCCLLSCCTCCLLPIAAFCILAPVFLIGCMLIFLFYFGF